MRQVEEIVEENFCSYGQTNGRVALWQAVLLMVLDREDLKQLTPDGDFGVVTRDLTAKVVKEEREQGRLRGFPWLDGRTVTNELVFAMFDWVDDDRFGVLREVDCTPYTRHRV